MVQKLVTFYLVSNREELEELEELRRGRKLRNFKAKEHLQEYLRDGWVIRDYKTLDGSSSGHSIRHSGWVVVLLDRSSDG